MRPRVLPSALFHPLAVAVALTTAVLLATSGPARAQWSSSASTNTQLSTFTSNSGIPSVYPDHAGGAVFAWSDARGAVVQRLDAFGFKMWGASATVISNTNQLFAMTKSISDDAGGVIVGWAQNGPSPGFYVQHVDRFGTQLWGAGGINLTAAGNVAKLCSDGAGGVIVVWTQVSGSLTQLYMNRVTAAGVVSWGASGKLVHASGDLKTINMLVPSTGSGAIVGWYNFLNANLSDPDTLFFQRVDGSGNPQWPTPGSPSFVRVITLDDTAIEMACTGNAGAAYYTTQRADSLFLHLLQPAGTFTSPVAGWAIAGPTTAKVKLGLAKYMIEDGSGGVVVGWRDESYGGSIFGRIRAQRLNATGQRQWPTAGGTFVEVCGSSNDQSFPGILRDGYGNYLFGWEDYRNGVNINLWSQKLEPVAGAKLWAAAGVFFASATDNQFAPRFAAGNPGNAIAGFDDARTGQERMYAQFLGPLAALTPINTVSMTTRAPGPVARTGAGYATVDSALFVNGGGSVANVAAGNLASYTPGSNTWATIGSYQSRWNGSLTYVPETGKLYAMNGYDNAALLLSSVEEIAPAGGAAVLKTANPVPRESPAVAAWGGKIYVFGGFNGPLLGGLTGIGRAFDPVANSWSNTTNLPLPNRSGAAAVAYNGSIFVVGGTSSSGSSKRIDRYDVASNTWTNLADAPLPVALQAATVTGGLLWFAGDTSTGWTLMSYAPATDTWTMHTTNMVSRRNAALGGVGGTLVVAGGAMGSPLQDVLETQTSDVSTLVAATPLASVTLPVSALANATQLGELIFAAPAESTLVTLNVASVGAAGTATVERYPGPAANVTFSAAPPTSVGTTRWVMSESGLAPLSATVAIQLFGLPDALGAGSGISIYRRSSVGTGAFDPLPTTFDAATGRVSADVTALGEFILGSGGAVDVAGGGAVPLALAIRPLGANPVRGRSVAFSVSLPAAGTARLDLFDVQGRVVASRALSLGAGVHAVGMGDGRSVVAPGLYFARVVVGGSVARGRVVVVE